MKVYVDKDICIGCGLCPTIGPDVFRMNDDIGKAEAISNDISSDLEDQAKEGEENCPVGAIAVNNEL
ncbi:MAG: ferredoxin [Oscillospiraceae bacterium]|nr:ferredoxin [Oscillospiraceae bacterium]